MFTPFLIINLFTFSLYKLKIEDHRGPNIEVKIGKDFISTTIKYTQRDIFYINRDLVKARNTLIATVRIKLIIKQLHETFIKNT